MIDRIEPDLTERFRKDPEKEAFLSRLNRILAPYQEEDYVPDLPERYPTVHVIGVPRSGTTLLTQLLAAHTDIGYINNLIAAFWKAPVYGIRLSAQVVPQNMGSSYRSEFGRTRGIHEPHEFGYFWSDLLNYREMREGGEEREIDWNRVRLVLTNMTRASMGPILFKSFLLGWHIPEMQQILPRTCWLHIKRDPVQNALSLLRVRREYLGSIEEWGSMKPKEYSWLQFRPYCEQVAGQVYFLEKRYREQLRMLPTQNVISLSYRELCQSPASVISQVQQLLETHGATIEVTASPPPFFPMQQHDLNHHPDGMQLHCAWQRICDQFGPLE